MLHPYALRASSPQHQNLLQSEIRCRGPSCESCFCGALDNQRCVNIYDRKLIGSKISKESSQTPKLESYCGSDHVWGLRRNSLRRSSVKRKCERVGSLGSLHSHDHRTAIVVWRRRCAGQCGIRRPPGKNPSFSSGCKSLDRNSRTEGSGHTQLRDTTILLFWRLAWHHSFPSWRESWELWLQFSSLHWKTEDAEALPEQSGSGLNPKIWQLFKQIEKWLLEDDEIVQIIHRLYAATSSRKGYEEWRGKNWDPMNLIVRKVRAREFDSELRAEWNCLHRGYKHWSASDATCNLANYCVGISPLCRFACCSFNA